MKRGFLVAAVFASSTALAGGAVLAANAPPPATTAPPTAEMKAADTDFTKLSQDGAAAYRDVRLARLAIYEASPKQAETFTGRALAALDRAKGDRTVFMKAASELAPNPSTQPAAKSADAKGGVSGASAESASKTPVAWLPVDAQMLVGEDYTASPQKAAAVATANQHLAKGDAKKAAEVLRLQGVDVQTDLTVMPLASSTEHVKEAHDLIAKGKYYEANAALKAVEDGTMIQIVDYSGNPKAAASAAAPDKAATDTAPAHAAPAQAAPAQAAGTTK